MIVATANDVLGGRIYVSSDAGVTWQRTSAPVTPKWWRVACSADGTRIFAAGGGLQLGQHVTGRIYASTNSGKTWQMTDAPQQYWQSIATSADGAVSVAAASGADQFGELLKNPIFSSHSIQQPLLQLTPSSAGLRLSWTVPSTAFVLEENHDLSSPGWAPASVNPKMDYATLEYQVALPSSPGTSFFRLSSR